MPIKDEKLLKAIFTIARNATPERIANLKLCGKTMSETNKTIFKGEMDKVFAGLFVLYFVENENDEKSKLILCWK